jgi:hypothetical protein
LNDWNAKQKMQQSFWKVMWKMRLNYSKYWDLWISDDCTFAELIAQ